MIGFVGVLVFLKIKDTWRNAMKSSLVLLLMMFAAFAFASPVNVNKASAPEIAEALSGIGLKKAEAIIKYREANGEFKSVQALTNVKGIGDKTVEKNKVDILLKD